MPPQHHHRLGADTDGPRDASWIGRLPKNRAGQLLRNHLACKEDRLRLEGHDDAVQCCVESRRAFLHAVLSNAKRGKDHPCGLPRPMPKYVGVLNLSGERMLVYSGTDTLLRKLCGHSSTTHAQELRIQLQQFSNWLQVQQAAGASTQESFVLITYQMPWETGIRNTHWEVNTVLLTSGASPKDATLIDRGTSLTSLSPCVFKGRPSLADVESLPTPSGKDLELLPPRQVLAFRDDYAASCLDHDDDDDEGPQPPQPPHAGEAVGLAAVQGGGGFAGAAQPPSRKQYDNHRDEIVRNVQETHKKLRLEVGQLTRQNAALQTQLDGVAATVDAAVQAKLDEQKAKHDQELKLVCADRDVTKTELEGMRNKMGTMLREQSQISNTHKKLVALHATSKMQHDAQNKLSNSQNQKLVRERNELEERLATQKATHKKALADLGRTHSRDLERAVEDEHRKVVALNDTLVAKDRLMNQLAEINDRKDTELQAVQAQLQASVGRRNAEDECAIAALRAALRDAESELLKERQISSHFHVRMATAEAKVLAARAKVLEAKAAKAAGVPERSVASSTDTIATATHECASTQTTEQSRVLPEHLPTSVKVLAKVDDALCVVAGTQEGAARRGGGGDTTVGEDASPGSSTGSTNAQTAHATAVQQQQQQQHQDPAETPHFHALTALSAVQWLVQWTSQDAASLSASPPPQHQFCHSQLYAPPPVVYHMDGQHPHWRGEIPFAQFPMQQQQQQQQQPTPAYDHAAYGGRFARGRAAHHHQPQPRHNHPQR